MRPSRHLAHGIQSRAGRAGSDLPMVQGLGAASVPYLSLCRCARELSCRLYRTDRPGLSGALRRDGAAPIPAALHRGGAVEPAWLRLTRTLAAVGPVSPASST